MSIDSGALHMNGALEVYKLLDELDRHINSHDASGRAVLYQAKERLRSLIISMDRSKTV
jgi:hypothetical protein